MKIWTYKLVLSTDVDSKINFTINEEDGFTYHSYDKTYRQTKRELYAMRLRFNYLHVAGGVNGSIVAERSFGRKLNDYEIKLIKYELAEELQKFILCDIRGYVEAAIKRCETVIKILKDS